MNTKAETTRRYYLDWLRMLLILTVLLFHSLRFFDLEGWYVKSATTYLGVQVLVVFISRWLMPVIFLISGMATFYALEKYWANRFIKERTLRLLVPLLVGLLTHIPLQGYLKEVSQNQYSGSFWQWYPSMFGNFNWLGAHLWYLEVLFLFSLICLPLFVWLRNRSGKRVLSFLGERLSKPGAIYLLVLPILILSATLDPDNGSILTSEDFGGWNLPSHLIFFLSGFVIASSQLLQTSICRKRWASLVTGVVVFFVGGGILLALTEGDAAFGTPFYLCWTAVSSLTAWAFMLAILGFGMQGLNFRTPLLDYANEGVLPFYALHQSILFVVGFYVLNWAMSDLTKWAIILISSFVIIMVLYEFLIRRNNVLRLLFGMKSQGKPPAPLAKETALAG